MASQNIPVTAGCTCGARPLRSHGRPTQGFYCHCTTCRKSYGRLFQVTVKFDGKIFRLPKDGFKYYRSSEFAKRGFCAECGSPIVFLYEGNPNVWALSARSIIRRTGH